MISESTMNFTINGIFGTGTMDGWVKTLCRMENELLDERNVGAGFLSNGGPFKEISKNLPLWQMFVHSKCFELMLL